MKRDEHEQDQAIERLLAAARRADLPGPERVTRVRERLLPPHAAAPQPSATAKQWSALHGMRALVGIGGCVAVVVGALVFRQASPRPSDPVPTVSTPVSVPEPAAPEVVAPVEAAPAPSLEKPELPAPPPRRSKPRAIAKRAPAPAADTHDDSLQSAASLLRVATLALRAGRTEEARGALDRFARAYPNSQLRLEYERLVQQLAEASQKKSATGD